MDDIVSEIQKFCEMYEGTAIGEETKHRLDNAEGNEEAIENIFMALKEDGWIQQRKIPFNFIFYISHIPKSNPEFIHGLLFGGIATTTWISCNYIITRQNEE